MTRHGGTLKSMDGFCNRVLRIYQGNLAGFGGKINSGTLKRLKRLKRSSNGIRRNGQEVQLCLK